MTLLMLTCERCGEDIAAYVGYTGPRVCISCEVKGATMTAEKRPAEQEFPIGSKVRCTQHWAHVPDVQVDGVVTAMLSGYVGVLGHHFSDIPGKEHAHWYPAGDVQVLPEKQPAVCRHSGLAMCPAMWQRDSLTTPLYCAECGKGKQPAWGAKESDYREPQTPAEWEAFAGQVTGEQSAETDLGQVAYDAWQAAWCDGTGWTPTPYSGAIGDKEREAWQAAAAAVKLEVLLQEPEPEPPEPRIWICEVAEGPGAPLYRYLACGVGDPAEHWTQVDLQQGLTLRFRYSDADSAPVQTPPCIHDWQQVRCIEPDGSVWGCTKCPDLQIRRLPDGAMW